MENLKSELERNFAAYILMKGESEAEDGIEVLIDMSAKTQDAFVSVSNWHSYTRVVEFEAIVDEILENGVFVKIDTDWTNDSFKIYFE